MITVFIEYKLVEEKRKQFAPIIKKMGQWIAEHGGVSYRCLEGVEQPNLIVESFDVESAEKYREIKQMRLCDEVFLSCIAGGAEKLHIWAFAPLRKEEA